MTEVDVPVADADTVLTDDPFARLDGSLAGTRRMRLAVAANQPLTPSMQQVVLSSPDLHGFTCRPGQDLMLLVAADGARPVRRRYTIRGLNGTSGLVTLGIVRHGDGPGERWLRDAVPGHTVAGIGPRGKVFPAEGVDWHLFAGDLSSLPAFFVMAESLPYGTPVSMVIEVPSTDDEQPLDAAAKAVVTWLHQGSRPPGDPAGLTAALQAVALPPGTGHAYLMGEAKVVLAMREVLAARGMAPEHVSAKAYWGRGKANASHGEPPASP